MKERGFPAQDLSSPGEMGRQRGRFVWILCVSARVFFGGLHKSVSVLLNPSFPKQAVLEGVLT